ncbi:MAG: hypothetical protein ACREJU_14090 [Nitrospiraceae bacterium]
MTRATVTKGSGNVFRDLGFSEEKSAELILKVAYFRHFKKRSRTEAGSKSKRRLG